MEKTIKAWAVYRKRDGDIADTIYATKKDAEDGLRVSAYEANPLRMKELMRRYKIVRLTITYKSSA